jgi:hypothetical protein
MEIIFSRHAKRRMALYGISREDVLKTLERGRRATTGELGRNESIDQRLTGKYGYPIKVVFNEEQGRLTVVTAYPLKKERKKP